ncbi:hypothetical protein CDL15_Pgr005532 [Punica granatum]|uniref:Uncharacterized protein n=1 Tax=Punica granatum TaxID=22663 RepID=A0A218WVN7_PUNGR|nr:hypothetical protein CDL15_Pgr005532 [Punica granatum]
MDVVSLCDGGVVMMNLDSTAAPSYRTGPHALHPLLLHLLPHSLPPLSPLPLLLSLHQQAPHPQSDPDTAARNDDRISPPAPELSLAESEGLSGQPDRDSDPIQGQGPKRKKKRARKKSKRPDLDKEEEHSTGGGDEKKAVGSGSSADLGFLDKPELICLYPFTSLGSATQRRIKQQYDELVTSHYSKGLTLAQICIGQNSCTVPVTPEIFGRDPCPSVMKKLSAEAHVFKSHGACAGFLANYNPRSFAKVSFGNMHYNLPPWSISILPDCKNTVYNTARVGAQTARMKMTPVPVRGGFSWQAYDEETTAFEDSSFMMIGLLEQINATRDISDYLWYMTDVNINSKEAFLRGSAYGSLEFPKLTFSESVNLRPGVNKISLLSIAVGLPNVGPHFERWNAGVLGPVTLCGLNEGRRDLTWEKWSYKVGLKGEALSLHSLSGSSSVEWAQGSLVARRQPLTWYKTVFNAPAGNTPLTLDMGSMGKGTYSEKKCLSNCGESSRRWYHVPRSWLNPTGNLLVLFEEWGGDLNGISLVRRDIDSVCADIYEWQPTLINYEMQSSGKVNKPLHPKAHLSRLSLLALGRPRGPAEVSVKEAVMHTIRMMSSKRYVSPCRYALARTHAPCP